MSSSPHRAPPASRREAALTIVEPEPSVLTDAELLTIVLAGPCERAGDPAGDLIERFGSVGAVLAADAGELRKSGAGGSHVQFLQCLREMAIRSAREDASRRPVISSWSSLRVQDKVSKLTGTILEPRTSRSSASGFARGGSSVSRSTTERPLLEPGEIRALPDDQQLVFVAGHRPLRFAAAVVALGLPLFQLYSQAASGEAGRIRTTVLAALLLAVAAAGGLLAQTAMMAGGWALALDPAAIGYVVQSTSLGTAHVARIGLSLLGVVLALLGRGRRSMSAMAAVAFAGAVASFAWSGHGASSEGAAGLVHLVADITHALAAAVWLGALAGFLTMLARNDRSDAESSARSLAGFGTVGTAAVLALTLTGMVNAAFLVRTEGSERLASSAWGQLLFAKLLLFTIMVWLASHNRYTLTPALKRAIEAGDDTGEAVRGLRVSVGVEMAAGILLLGLVAAMGVQMPPASM